MYSGHRAHGHALAKGAPAERVLAELMGRSDGLCGGLGGSMHLVDTEHGLMGATGVVGGNVPLALGSALAARLEGSDQVAVVFFGDGAVQAGHFNESVNLAALWGLPVIFVCENNGFAEFTPRSAHTNVERVSDVVAPYDVTRDTVDGNDVVAVRDGLRPLPRRGAQGQGPDAARVPHPQAARALRGRPGPLPRGAGRRGLAGEGPDPALPAPRRGRGLVGREGARGRGDEARDAVEEAVSFARASPAPEPGAIEDLVYAPSPSPASAGAARGRGGTRTTTYLKEINATLAEAMRADAQVFVIGEDVAEGGPYTATAGLAEEFGTERVVNTPISEAAICGVAVGAAQSGLRPVLEIMFIDFITLAFDQLVNQAAKAYAMSGGPAERAARGAHPGRRRAARRRAALAEPRGLAHARAGAEGRDAQPRGGRAGPAGQRDRRPQPGGVHREQDPVLQARGGPG